MYVVINDGNEASYDPPSWADTPEKAMTAAAAAIAVSIGNVTLVGDPSGFTLWNARGTEIGNFRVITFPEPTPTHYCFAHRSWSNHPGHCGCTS
jgi:hypothetical protein